MISASVSVLTSLDDELRLGSYCLERGQFVPIGRSRCLQVDMRDQTLETRCGVGQPEPEPEPLDLDKLKP